VNIKTAELIVERLEEASKSMFSLIPEIEEGCTKEEFEKIKREIARASGIIDGNIYPIILRQYPELDPLKET